MSTNTMITNTMVNNTKTDNTKTDDAKTENTKNDNIITDNNLAVNSIADNIICLSQDLLPNNYTLLTLALKKTMKQKTDFFQVRQIGQVRFGISGSDRFQSVFELLRIL